MISTTSEVERLLREAQNEQGLSRAGAAKWLDLNKPREYSAAFHADAKAFQANLKAAAAGR